MRSPSDARRGAPAREREKRKRDPRARVSRDRSRSRARASLGGAIVTGGAAGIGKAVARLLERDGFEVCTVDLARGATVRGDIRDPDTARRAIASLRRPVAALVNCAGTSEGGVLHELELETWNRVIGVDLTGAFVFMREVAAPMIRAERGRIVNVASTLALRARRGTAAYAAAKAGLVGLTRAAARDLGRYGITVNAVAPGLVLTALGRKVPAHAREKLLEETALGRFAQPEDVAEVIAFLCSDRSKHITGEVIRVDGGQLA